MGPHFYFLICFRIKCVNCGPILCAGIWHQKRSRFLVQNAKADPGLGPESGPQNGPASGSPKTKNHVQHVIKNWSLVLHLGERNLIQDTKLPMPSCPSCSPSPRAHPCFHLGRRPFRNWSEGYRYLQPVFLQVLEHLFCGSSPHMFLYKQSSKRRCEENF